MKVVIVGATGLVGSKMLQVLAERQFPVTKLIPVASSRSAGKHIVFNGSSYPVVTADEALSMKPDVALFSAGAGPSLELAPKFAAIGCRVIDNSSAWRMDTSIKLVVPEINGYTLTVHDLIIANPNCSTIQMVMVLQPLHEAFGVKRVVVSTYQSVSGTGQKALQELQDERNGGNGFGVYPHRIDLNLIPQIDVFLDNGYSKEEMKMANETCKIMGDNNIKVTATTVRVPVTGGHSESVNIEFHNDFTEQAVHQLLSQTPGVTVIDDPKKGAYPMPIDAEGKDEVFVGRIRRDHSQPKTLNCWIVADNLRKGAATNAVQIAELLHKKGWIY